jgi:hypothetical protein
MVSLKAIEERQDMLLSQQQKILNKLGCIEDLAEEVIATPCKSLQELQDLSASLETNQEKRKKFVRTYLNSTHYHV